MSQTQIILSNQHLDELFKCKVKSTTFESVTNITGLKNIIRYTGVLVVSGFVTSGFPSCNLKPH